MQRQHCVVVWKYPTDQMVLKKCFKTQKAQAWPTGGLTLMTTMLKILALGVILGVSIKLIRVLPYLGNCENLKTLEYNNVK